MKKRIWTSAIVLAIGSFATAQAASAATTATYNANAAVTFNAGTGVTPPVDPTDPGTAVTPTNPDGSTPSTGTAGPLSIDFASSLSFGAQNISAQDATYYAHAQNVTGGSTATVPDYVQVTDTRGTFAGWTLTAQTSSQLHLASVNPSTNPDNAAPGDYLTGATLNFTGGYVAGTAKNGAPNNIASTGSLGTAAITIMSAKANTGVGTWMFGFGNGTSGSSNSVLSANNSAYQENGGSNLTNDAISTKSPITLKVPGNTPKKAAAYTTNIIWSLSDVPGN